MSAAPQPRPLTDDEYLAIERKAKYKSEFVDGALYAMAGASPPHNDVKDNLALALGNRLRGRGCRANTSDQRVRAGTRGRYFYPDIVITCGEREYAANDPHTLTNPTVLIEVLSPSTRDYDRGDKLRAYQQVASLREYVMVDSERAVVERIARQPDGTWRFDTFVGLDAVLEFAGVPAAVPLAEVYADVTFPPAPPDEDDQPGG
ncbi:MAG: Uma2 family endonuclease [Gemmataceae bacterium]|nr:Uma2 family endonuclease [Gemmataceae bacterium]